MYPLERGPSASVRFLASSVTKRSAPQKAESIRTQGVLSPLLVRPVTENGFEIVAGARRYRAAQMAEQTRRVLVIMAANGQPPHLMSDETTVGMNLRAVITSPHPQRTSKLLCAFAGRISLQNR